MILKEGFPAGCLRLNFVTVHNIYFNFILYERVIQDTQIFQHTAGFFLPSRLGRDPILKNQIANAMPFILEIYIP